MKIAAVILNYNDEDTTIESILRAEKIKGINYIILVDNHSDSYARLADLCSKKVHFLRTDKNLGYAGGNNVGIRFAINNLQVDYVIISNPDVEFDDEFISRSIKVFSEFPDAGQVTCVMDNGRHHDMARKLPNNFELMLSNIPGISKMSWIMGYSKKYLSKKVCEVGQVWGSLLMLSRDACIETGGFDDDTFLYYEEAILGKRLRAAGYKTYLITDYSFIHHESVSICKTFSKAADRMKIMYASQLIYSKKYLQTGQIGLMCLKLSQNLGLFLYSLYWHIKRS